MPKADVINMADHRELINPVGTISFAFETVMTEQELEAKVQLIADLIQSLGGKLEDGRGEAVWLEATDSSSGTDWQAEYEAEKYMRAPVPRGLSLEQILEYMDCHQPAGENFLQCNPKQGFEIVYRGDGYDEFTIWQLHVNIKRNRVLYVFTGDNSAPLKKKDLEQPGAVVIFHRVRPQR